MSDVENDVHCVVCWFVCVTPGVVVVFRRVSQASSQWCLNLIRSTCLVCYVQINSRLPPKSQS